MEERLELGEPQLDGQIDAPVRMVACGWQVGIAGAYDVDIETYTRDTLYDPQTHASEYRAIEPDILALAQTLSRLVPDPYLEERAARATGQGLQDFLNQVPDVEPEDYDRLPAGQPTEKH